MATYESWSRAIAAYFTAGAAKGSPIFLSVDVEALEETAFGFLDEPVAGDPEHDFLSAVRYRCVVPYRNTVRVDGLRLPIGSVPAGVGFLAVLVYAAHKMHEEGSIDEKNYFLRLREALGLPHQDGRPDGLPHGAEEPLWKMWNQYLVVAGFLQTAVRGVGSQTYIQYALSQAILRESDKQYLRQRFRDANLPPQLDCDQLGFWLSRQQLNRRHLADGVRHPDAGRALEFCRAAHRVYDAGGWVAGSEPVVGESRASSRAIESGLYRTEDLLGGVEYWAFPKQPARVRVTAMTVESPAGTAQPLRQLRAGFFRPTWPQSPFVDAVVEHKVSGDPNVRALLFPKREFWLLTRDPENPSGVWASWKAYSELGESLLVLCRPGAFDAEMGGLREAKLIDWANRVECRGWVEYHGCMVLSYDWGGFIPTSGCRALVDALAPRSLAGVSLLGGLRDPNQNAWLEGFPPLLKVYGFEREFEVVITSSGGAERFRQNVGRQSEVAVPNGLEADTYQIEAKTGGERVAIRVFRVLPWSCLQEHPEPESVTNCQVASTAGLRLRGALICEAPISCGEVPNA